MAHMAASRTVLCLVFAALAALCLPVAAQISAPTSGGSATPADTPPRGAWLPGGGRSYLGLNLGRSRYGVSCGSPTLLCDNKDTSAQLYAGAMLGNFWGVELGYLHMGRISRGGGETQAQGLNVSLIGKAQLAHSLGIFGKIGTTYGRTETSALAASSIPTGSEQGFGLSYGGGISYDFSPRLSATLGWDSNDFRFAGGGRDPVRATSLGLQYRY